VRAGLAARKLKGKQYIVIPIGSRTEPAEYVALALP
jgi:hypothetical protein